MKNTTKITIALVLALVTLLNLVSALTITDVSSSPSTVEPGKKISVSITVKNDLNEDIQNVAVSMDLTGLPIAPVESSTSFVEEIRSDKEDTFNFDLVVNGGADAKIYSIPVVASYHLQDSNQTTTLPLSLVSVSVNAKPILSLDAEGFLLEEQKGTITIKVTNSGLAKAGFLEASAQSGNYQILSPSRVYIGELNSNDFDSFTLDIFPNSKGTISIPVSLAYKDSLNNDYSETDSVSVRVYSQQEALSLGLIQKNNTALYVLGIIVLIILYIVYSRLRKWARNKKARANGGK